MIKFWICLIIGLVGLAFLGFFVIFNALDQIGRI